MRKKMAVWAMVSGLAVMLALAGCSTGDAVTAAQKISAYLPVVTALANDAAAVASAIDADDAALIQQVNARVQGELTELAKVAAAYVSSPTGDNWTKLSAVMDVLVNDADASLLQAAGIKNTESAARAKIALSALDAAVHVLDGYLAAARTPQQTKAAVATRRVKLAEVTRAWSATDWRRAGTEAGGDARGLAGLMQSQGY